MLKINKRYLKYIKLLLYFFVVFYIILFIIAFVMKDYAKSDYSRRLCQEYVNGTRNIVALVINKIRPDTIKYESNLINENEPKEISTIKDILNVASYQKKIDEKLIKEINSGSYSFSDPLIIQDPYGISPLTALIIYNTEKPELVTVGVKDKNGIVDIEHTFDKQGYTKNHVIPVMGLYPNYDNTIVLTSTTQDGEQKKNEFIIQTDELNSDLSNINFSVYKGDISKYQPGLNFSYQSINGNGWKLAFDKDGDIRWYFNKPSNMVSNFNKGRSIFTVWGSIYYGDVIICEQNYLGKILNLYYSPYGIHHDIYKTENNTLLITGNNRETCCDLINEMDLSSGRLLKNIDYRNLLPRTRKQIWLKGEVEPWGYRNDFPQDWMHMNSVVEYDNDVIISSNYQSTIMRNNKEGDIKWILADPRDFTTYWQQYLLRPIGEDFEYPYNQHAVEVLPDYDHNPDTVDILLFDNGSSRFLADEELQKNIKLGKTVEPKLYSRLVHYRINEKNMTVEQIWQYGEERPELFSPTRGDADLLVNGNILGTFNREFAMFEDTIYVEVNQNKDVIWECYASSNLSNNRYSDYRLERLPIYNDDNDYMDIEKEMNNFVPMEVLKKYGYQN